MAASSQTLRVSSSWLSETAEAIVTRNGVQLTDCVVRAENGEAVALPGAAALAHIDHAVEGLRRALLSRAETVAAQHRMGATADDVKERELYTVVLTRTAATGAIAAFLRSTNNDSGNVSSTAASATVSPSNNDHHHHHNNNNINSNDNSHRGTSTHAHSNHNSHNHSSANGTTHSAESSDSAVELERQADDVLTRGLLFAFEAFQTVHSMSRTHYAALRRGGSTVGTVGWDTLLLLHFVHSIPHVARRASAFVVDDAAGQVVRSWRKLLLSLQSADPREAPEHSRRRGALAVCNGLLRILFHRHNTHQCRVLLQTVAQSERLASSTGDTGKSILRPAQHMTAEVVCFAYHKGRLALYDGQLDEAHTALREAYLLLPPPGSGTELQQRNKQRVRFFLTVAGVANGRVVPEEILRTDDLIAYVFAPILAAMQRGDPHAFTAAVDAFASTLRRRGVYFLLLRAKPFCFLALLARTHAALAACGVDNSRLPLAVLTAAYAHIVAEGKQIAAQESHKKNNDTAAARRRQKRPRADDDEDDNRETLTDDEMTLWTAKLIASGLVRGYISYEHKTIVLSKKEPFPLLCQANPTAPQ